MVTLKYACLLSCASALIICALNAHPIDFHYRGPEDDQLEKEVEQKSAREEYNEVYNNPDSTQEDRDAATDRLDKAGMLA